MPSDLASFDLLTLAEVAELLHCSKAHVCKAVAGRVRGCPPIPAVSLGRRKLVRRATLLSWIERNEQAAANDTRCCNEFEHRQNEVPEDAHKENHMRKRHSTGGVRETAWPLDRHVVRRWQAEKQSDRFRQGHDQEQSAREEVARIVAEERAKRETNRAWKFGEFVEARLFPVLQPEMEALDAGKQREQGFGPSGCGVRGSGAFQLPAR